MKNVLNAIALLALVFVCALAMSLSLLNVSDMPAATVERIVFLQGRARLILLLAVPLLIAFKLLSTRLRFAPRAFTSEVPDHQGPCMPVWVNKNQIDYMLSGAFTGFFRRARRVAGLPLVWLSGPEFHGYVREDKVKSTVGYYGRLPA